MSVDWLPSWMDPYYQASSSLRLLYHSALNYQSNLLLEFAQNNLQGSFFGIEGQPRQCWIAKNVRRVPHTPQFVITTNTAYSLDTSVWEADSLGSFLYEPVTPVYYRDEETDTLYLRNLSIVKFPVQTTSGYLDLSGPYSLHTKVSDSPVWIFNAWGDLQIVDPTSARWKDSSKIRENNEGSYLVLYSSQELTDSFTTNDSYVTLDGAQIDLISYDYPNVWDNFAHNLGLTRLEGESNTQLKRRCQQYSLSTKLENRISAILNNAILGQWDTTQTLNFTGSGILQFESYLQQTSGQNVFDDLQIITEQPKLYQEHIYLSQFPSGLVQSTYMGRYVLPSTQTITENELTATGIQVDVPQQLNLTYKVQLYTKNVSGDFVTTIVPQAINPQSSYFVASRNVKISNASKRIKIWRWNGKEQANLGLATFY